MIAQIQSAPIPWSLTGNWFLGFIGALGVAALALNVAQQGRRLFGKHPVGKASKNHDKELHDELAQVAHHCERRHAGLRDDLDQRFRELADERMRSLGELHEKINAVAADVAFIRGKLSSGK